MLLYFNINKLLCDGVLNLIHLLLLHLFIAIHLFIKCWQVGL